LLEEIRVLVRSDADIVTARWQGRSFAQALGFTAIDTTMIVTAISELARNIVRYAGHGEIQLKVERNQTAIGMVVIASDHGPGILDVARALVGGFSTSDGLGLGLRGVQRLMDDIQVESSSGNGTVITTRKWKD
jgi:serine/threonine-protein kinase RsbT